MRNKLTVKELQKQLDDRYLQAGKVTAKYFLIDDLVKLERTFKSLKEQHDNKTNQQKQQYQTHENQHQNNQ